MAVQQASSRPLNEAVIKKQAGEYDVEILSRLSIPSLGLTAIAGLARCRNLVELALPDNAISRIEGLDTLVKLQRLDLSQNRISCVENLEPVRDLRFLDLRGNNLRKLDDLSRLASAAVPALEQLFLVDQHDSFPPNPVCSCTDYVGTVARLLPGLVMLDGEHLALRREMESCFGDQATGRRAVATPSTALPLEPWYRAEELDPDALFAGAAPLSPETVEQIKAIKGDVQVCVEMHEEAQRILADAEQLF